MPGTQPPAPQFAIIHSPGPKWQEGDAFMEQPGVFEHAGYFAALYEDGKVAFGGPFLDAAAGGTMVLAPGISHDEAESIADGDPGYHSGLLVYQIRPWLLAFPSKGT